MKTSKKQKNTGRGINRRESVPTIDYQKHLLKDLKDLDYAAGYLNASLEEGEDVFLLAVRDVVQAHCGMAALSNATKLNRENLYAMLSAEGNPRLSSLAAILDKLGLQIRFAAKSDTSAA
jgi:probable addiction module antidote protein